MRARIWPVAFAMALVAAAAPCLARADPLSAGHPKPVAFTIEEDFPKGTSLALVAKDFQLMRQLGITTLRESFAWDDFEPAPGQYDFTWLRKFLRLARADGIHLRPWVGYTPAWAAADPYTATPWNQPPKNESLWYAFVRRLTQVSVPYHVVLSYEIYNEENSPAWWAGTPLQYAQTLIAGAQAVHSVSPRMPILFGGMYEPSTTWLTDVDEAGARPFYDVIPFHAYPGTGTPGQPWSPGTVETYPGPAYPGRFWPYVKAHDAGKPVWVNEMGYATAPGKTERDQANWFARAFSTYLALPGVQELGVFRLRDLRPGNPNIGGEPNYHLGLVTYDGAKKLAFYTVKMLVHLLGAGTLTVADASVRVKVVTGQPGPVYHHLFLRPDGTAVLFLYDRTSVDTVDVTLRGLPPPAAAYRYALNGTRTLYPRLEGNTLRDVRLTPGNVAILVVDTHRSG